MHKIALAFIGTILATPVWAADMPVKAPPPVAPVWSWAGFYMGGNFGYSWGRAANDVTFISNSSGAAFATVSNTAQLNGALGGAQVGYNWQVNRLVLGAEADFQWTGERGSGISVCPTACSSNGPTSATVTPSIEWFQTLRGRLGVTNSGFMAYVTGGAAYGEVKTAAAMMGFGQGGAVITGNASWSSIRAGWVAGAGLETQFGDRWSGRIEYLYMDLGAASANTLSPFSGSFSSKITDNVFRVGMSYLFH
jgi:outer membrane immunogenic protein